MHRRGAGVRLSCSNRSNSGGAGVVASIVDPNDTPLSFSSVFFLEQKIHSRRTPHWQPWEVPISLERSAAR